MELELSDFLGKVVKSYHVQKSFESSLRGRCSALKSLNTGVELSPYTVTEILAGVDASIDKTRKTIVAYTPTEKAMSEIDLEQCTDLKRVRTHMAGCWLHGELRAYRNIRTKLAEQPTRDDCLEVIQKVLTVEEDYLGNHLGIEIHVYEDMYREKYVGNEKKYHLSSIYDWA